MLASDKQDMRQLRKQRLYSDTFSNGLINDNWSRLQAIQMGTVFYSVTVGSGGVSVCVCV